MCVCIQLFNREHNFIHIWKYRKLISNLVIMKTQIMKILIAEYFLFSRFIKIQV